MIGHKFKVETANQSLVRKKLLSKSDFETIPGSQSSTTYIEPSAALLFAPDDLPPKYILVNCFRGSGKSSLRHFMDYLITQDQLKSWYYCEY